jgi:hypothetical protein
MEGALNPKRPLEATPSTASPRKAAAQEREAAAQSAILDVQPTAPVGRFKKPGDALRRFRRASLVIIAVNRFSEPVTRRQRAMRRGKGKIWVQVSLQACKLIQIHTNTDCCFVTFCTLILGTKSDRQSKVAEGNVQEKGRPPVSETEGKLDFLIGAPNTCHLIYLSSGPATIDSPAS